MKQLSPDSPLMRLFDTAFSLIVLNVLTVVCCLPVVTGGAAVAALYASLFELGGGRGGLVTGYFANFKANLRRGIPLGLIWLVALAACAAYVMLFYDVLQNGGVLGWGAVFAICAVLLFPMAYLLPLQAKFENTAKQTVLNAFLMSFKHPLYTLALLALGGIPLALAAFMPSVLVMSIPVWLFFGFALIAWLKSKLLVRVFSKYAEMENQ